MAGRALLRHGKWRPSDLRRQGAETLVLVHDLYPSKEALDDAIASGSTCGADETFEQLDELLATLDSSVGRP
jgi:hypothetical protein